MKAYALILYLILSVFFRHHLIAQMPEKLNAAEIQLKLKKLGRLGSVLYVAAHPDDENTRLLAYLANEELLNTAYLSITRGDGGQNLIGPEIKEMLGVIRTQELLQARRQDGAQQFFTRAKDFGYSKSPEETFEVWDRQEVLADVVWVIRKFRPDIIITRFPGNGRGRHGQHTASAILAHDAFEAAGDPERFPDQLQYVGTWQPKSLLFNTHPWFYQDGEHFDSTAMVQLDVGKYNPLLGKSYTEIASESRSMHKSQGFGSTGTRGSAIEFLQPVLGDKITSDFFTTGELSWGRIPGSEEVENLLAKAYQNFDPEQPSGTVSTLLSALKALEQLPSSHYRNLKIAEVKELIPATLGLYLEASVESETATPGDSLRIRIEAINRSNIKVQLVDLGYDEIEKVALAPNQRYQKELATVIAPDINITMPYWLATEGSKGIFEVGDQKLIGSPENAPALTVPFKVLVAGHELIYEMPILHKRNDPVDGEIFQPFYLVPEVTVGFDQKVMVFADDQNRDLAVRVKSWDSNVSGKLSINTPSGWKVTPETIDFTMNSEGEEFIARFTVSPPAEANTGVLKAVAMIDGREYHREMVKLQYDHIPNQVLLPVARTKVVKLDIITRGSQIGYIMGAGDEIPVSLNQIGYQVDLLESHQIEPGILQEYDAIILGVRALNTVDQLKFDMQKLLDYVENGGTLIVQYNTNFRMVTDNFAPYPLQLSRDRVSVEEAPVTFLLPDHPALNFPNKITSADFDHWVQERGLYFPSEWDPRYQAILSTNDPGEEPKNGSLLIAQYGKGHYVYTGLSWFRELPAGVPGAYRLFANLISLGQEEPGN